MAVRQPPPGRKSDTVHLYMGAPPVRLWSEAQETNESWTLCGIKRRTGRGARDTGKFCTEDASGVSCTFCRELMRTGPINYAKRGNRKWNGAP